MEEIEEEILTFYYNGYQKFKSFQILQSALTSKGYSLVEFYNEFLIDIYILLDNPESKFIAIDWDNTISADQTFFIELIKQLQKSDYTPFVCTLRAPNTENIEEILSILEDANIAIYLTDGNPKREYMKDLGVDVHLWIDDFYPGICRETSSLLTRNHIK